MHLSPMSIWDLSSSNNYQAHNYKYIQIHVNLSLWLAVRQEHIMQFTYCSLFRTALAIFPTLRFWIIIMFSCNARYASASTVQLINFQLICGLLVHVRLIYSYLILYLWHIHVRCRTPTLWPTFYICFISAFLWPVNMSFHFWAKFEILKLCTKFNVNMPHPIPMFN